MIHIGIDPGKRGGIATVVYNANTRPTFVAAADLPVESDGFVDVPGLVAIMGMFALPGVGVRVLIEEQNVWRGRSIRNVGTEKILNQQAGTLWGALIAYGYACHWVPIHRWKRLTALGPPRYKLNRTVYNRMLLERTQQLFDIAPGVVLQTPRGRVLDGRCTAAMIARRENLE